jgi:hypothetical protein
MEVPLKTKNRTAIWLSNPVLGMYLKKANIACQGGTCTPMSSAALFTIAKIWKQPTWPWMTKRRKELCTCIWWNTTQLFKIMNLCHSQLHGWTWRTFSEVKWAVHRKTNITWSHWYVSKKWPTHRSREQSGGDQRLRVKWVDKERGSTHQRVWSFS